jgi:hypothetical protein
MSDKVDFKLRLFKGAKKDTLEAIGIGKDFLS